MGKKVICKRAVQGIIFVALLVAMLACFRSIFSIKTGDGIYSMLKFYEQEEDTVDVLVLGSSHAYTNVNTAELWNNHGIAAYVLGGSQQPLWNTYYYLEEALKTQTPELIVLEGYMTTFAGDYLESNRIISNTYGMKWSKTRIDAILASVPAGQEMEYLLEYVQYHSRYSDITSGDFLENQGLRKYENWKGYVCNTGIKPLEAMNVTGTTERQEMSEKSELYFRKIIELAKEKQIPICVVVSPYPTITETEEKIYNYVSDICDEYDVNYINYNFYVEEIGLVINQDFYDDSHLNDTGGEKYAKVLGEYLKENYEISDRRGETKWTSWDTDARYIESILKIKRFQENIDVKDALATIEDENYIAFVSLSENANDDVRKELAAITGVTVEWLTDVQMFVYQNGEISHVVTTAEEMKNVVKIDEKNVIFSREADVNGVIQNSISIDDEIRRRVTNGYNVVVYDEILGEVIDTFGIWSSNPTVCIRR